jgi:hypothetical protein
MLVRPTDVADAILGPAGENHNMLGSRPLRVSDLVAHLERDFRTTLICESPTFVGVYQLATLPE